MITRLSCLINISINLLLRKGIDPYNYMDQWGKFNKTSIPKKDELFSKLNMEDVTDADYMQKSLQRL